MSRARPRPVLIALTALVGAGGLAAPGAASAASYRPCSASSVRTLQPFAAGFVTAEVRGISCRAAVRLVRPALKAASTSDAPPRIPGWRCRVSGSDDASDGGDPFVRYTCSRGTRRIRVALVN